MSLALVIHTENKNNLKRLFELINNHPNKSEFSLVLNAKGYLPWEDEILKNSIINFKEFYAYPTQKNRVESIVELISKSKSEKILLLDENIKKLDLTLLNEDNHNSLYFRKKDLIKVNLDTKYQTIKWFIVDLLSQIKKIKINAVDKSADYERYSKKIQSPLFQEKVIYIDGGMGDHIMALPLLEKAGKDVYVSCKYPFVYEHLELKGNIHWNEELFGGYNRFVYEYGSANNSKTIVDAFFEMYGYERTKNDVLKYTGKREENPDIPQDKKIALICTSAAKVQGLDSNKDWRDIRWLKLVNELQKMGYFVVQVGSKPDNQIPNVNLKFLDKPLPNIADLVDRCSLWVSVDTFFHHFASAIKPQVGVCLTPFYNDHAKHSGVTYIEKDCGKDFSERRWWLDLQQPERKECMDLIKIEDVLNSINEKTSKLKILIASLQFNGLSGSELYVYELAKQFVKMGHDVSVIAEVIGGKLTKMAEKENIKVFSMCAPLGYEYGKTPENSHLLYKTHDVKFDIIHVNQYHITDFICKLYPNVKKIATIHSEVIEEFEKPYIHESIVKYICIRPEIQNHIIKNYNISREKTTLIYNPVDNNKFKNKNNSDKNYILFVGSLNYLRQKPTFDLIERAKKEGKELWIVGYSNGSPYIDDILGIEHLKYFEDTQNIEEFVKNSSYTVSVLFGRTAIESFMCGKNCLIYDIDEVGNILNSKMHTPPNDLKKYYSDNVGEEIVKLYYNVLEKTTRFPVCINVNFYNKHLLNQNIENCLEFTNDIFLNIEDELDLYIDEFNELKNKKLIKDFLKIKNKTNFFADLNYNNFITFDADEFIEYDKVKDMANFFESNKYSSLDIKVIKHFKNLNHELISEIPDYKKIVFSTKETNNDFVTDIFELHDVKQTYIENKSERELEVHKNFYYFNDFNTLTINNKIYKIERKDKCFLKFKNLKNVIVFCKDANDNCSNWRAFQPYDRFENNINYDIDSNLVFNLDKVKNYDLFIISRPILNIAWYFKMIMESGVKVMVDYDDPFPLEPCYVPNYREIMKECYNIIWDNLNVLSTTTEALQRYYQLLTLNEVVCLPNIVKPNLYTPKIERNDGKIYLGWYGSGGHIVCLEKIKNDIFKILDEFENVYFVLATDNIDLKNFMNHPKTIHHNYDFNFLNFEKSYSTIDINLSPLAETPDFLCKSNIRVQLAAMKGIPSIATNFGEYKIFGRLNNGALLTENDEWYDKIKFLVTNENERIELGKRAKETIEKYYNYKKHSFLRDVQIKKIINRAKI